MTIPHTAESLTEFLTRHLVNHPDQDAVTNMLLDLVKVGKEISHQTNKAGLVGILGATGAINVQDEEVQKLDVFANDLCKKVFAQSDHFVAYASEEETEVVDISNGNKDANYVIAFDPLDGSSNIDVNVSVGTIFSVYRKVADLPASDERHFLQQGSAQVLAGYILYGSSTVLVFTVGNGVHECTLDHDTESFFVSQEQITIPETPTYMSVNESNMAYMNEVDVAFVKHTRTAYNMNGRYIGSLVADAHRNMLKGGLFFYPSTDKKGTGEFNGKLRVNFELKPFAYLFDQAGGKSVAGQEDVMTYQSTSLHERAPLLMGNADIVTTYIKS